MSSATPNFKRTKFACYAAYFTMSSIFSLPPLLFVIFRETYGISYTLLGTLVLTNFCTQLAVDLAISRGADDIVIIGGLSGLLFSVVRSLIGNDEKGFIEVLHTNPDIMVEQVE